LLEVGLQTGAVLTLEGTELIDLLLQRAAFTSQLSHHLLVFGLGLALSVIGLASRRCHHGVGL